MTQKDYEKQAAIKEELIRQNISSQELVVSKSKHTEIQRILWEAGQNRRNHQYQKAIDAILQLVERLKKERQQRRQKEISLQIEGSFMSQQQKSIEVVYYLLAQAYLWTKNYDSVSRYYELSIKENPKFEPAYRQLATFFYQIKQYNKAAKTYQRWAEIAQERGQIWTRLADIYSLYNLPEVACKLNMRALSVGTKERIDRQSFSLQQQEDLIVSNI